ncbi:MAG: tetratricopeptide repeat protein [Gammaproteobacteria bacterium]|nr:tetratricopeptide repeat protein [Gammaproteobacteria bacterium]
MAKNKKPHEKNTLSQASNNSQGNTKKLAQFKTQIITLYQQGKTQAALQLSEQALEQFPQDLTLSRNAVGFADILGNSILFEKYTLQTLKINPNDADMHYNLANVLRGKGQLTDAQTHYRTALKLNPNGADAHNNLANILKDQGQLTKAKTHYQAALQIHPNYVDAHYNLANLLQDQKQFTEAQTHYQTALKLNPNYVTTHWDLSILFLTLGNFQQGWKSYEFRYHPNRKNNQSTPLKTSIPHYQGEDLNGKNILVYREQGLGDEIQFIRYLPLLKSQKGVKRITLVCKPALKKLFSSMACIDHLFNEEELKHTDTQGLHYWVLNMSLPLHFNTTINTIPNQLPYLSPPQQEQDNWQNKLPSGFNIGLVWKGSSKHKNDKNRSLPSLKTLAPLWQTKNNLNFISLQKGAGEEEAQNPPFNQPLTHLGNQIQDFADTAAILPQLDLVICVDTAIAHLAGALNIPCWVLLPDYRTDWRWMLDRTDTPWYPNTLRLFRQTTDGDWDGVIDKVVEALYHL